MHMYMHTYIHTYIHIYKQKRLCDDRIPTGLDTHNCKSKKFKCRIPYRSSCRVNSRSFSSWCGWGNAHGSTLAVNDINTPRCNDEALPIASISSWRECAPRSKTTRIFSQLITTNNKKLDPAIISRGLFKSHRVPRLHSVWSGWHACCTCMCLWCNRVANCVAT